MASTDIRSHSEWIRCDDARPRRTDTSLLFLLDATLGMLHIALLALAITTVASAQQHVSLAAEDGGRVCADLYGDGTRAVVLAHGGRLNKESWHGQANALVSAGFLALAIDFRGFGCSTGPGQDDFDHAPFDKDVLAAVRYLKAHGARACRLLEVASAPQPLVMRRSRRPPGRSIASCFSARHRICRQRSSTRVRCSLSRAMTPMMPVCGFQPSALRTRKLQDQKNSSFWMVPRTRSFFSKRSRVLASCTRYCDSSPCRSLPQRKESLWRPATVSSERQPVQTFSTGS